MDMLPPSDDVIAGTASAGRVQCRTSVPRTLGFAILAILMTALSWFVAQASPSDIPERLVAWFGVVFFGAAWVLILLQLFRRKPTVILDEMGILDTRMGVGVIRWEDIESVSVAELHRQRFLCLWLRNEEQYAARAPRSRQLLGRASRALGYSPFSIAFNGLTPGLDEAWEFIRQRVRERPGV